MMRIHLPVMLVFFLLISSTASLAVFEFITAETDTYAHVYSGGGKENNFASDGFLKMEWQYTSPDDGFLIPRVFLEKSRPYLKFDLSSIPDDATIVYADVVMAQWMGSTQDNIGLYKVSDNNLDGVPWTDTNLNWKNAPVNWDRGLTTSVGSGQQWVTFPLYASEVQASLRSNKISFAMKFENETANKYHVFCGEGFSNRWGCTTTAGFDKTEPELRVTYTLPCDRYTGIVDGWYECMSDTRCTWCGGCQLGTVARASCMNKEQCTRTCVLGQCGAECSGTSQTYDRCDGDLLNYSWTCSSNCTWQHRTTN
ncbi:DNRLRE domain-containing protein, partial [Candidatus Woesearchaeota archaeon]|nr:DNRLRE domain-containing protein [Candidatus Woesearchaeota archaeon]